MNNTLFSKSSIIRVSCYYRKSYYLKKKKMLRIIVVFLCFLVLLYEAKESHVGLPFSDADVTLGAFPSPYPGHLKQRQGHARYGINLPEMRFFSYFNATMIGRDGYVSTTIQSFLYRHFNYKASDNEWIQFPEYVFINHLDVSSVFHIPVIRWFSNDSSIHAPCKLPFKGTLHHFTFRTMTEHGSTFLASHHLRLPFKDLNDYFLLSSTILLSSTNDHLFSYHRCMTSHGLPSSLRLFSQNIQHFEEPWDHRAASLAFHFRQSSANVVLLQEVRVDERQPYLHRQSPSLSFSPKFSKNEQSLFSSTPFASLIGSSQLEHLLVDFHLADDFPYFVFQPAMAYAPSPNHHEEGLAILSKFPMIDSSFDLLSMRLTHDTFIHQRIVLYSSILVSFNSSSPFVLLAMNTHLSLDAANRFVQVQEINELASRLSSDLVVLGGDLNAEPHESSISYLCSSGFVDVGRDDPTFTFSTNKKFQKRIDYLFYRPFSLSPSSYSYAVWNHTFFSSPSSDHFGVFVSFSF
mmetsp:Transcript_6990/g.10252  ORF Transcript_6990/g.10252 Transcript_6990/m.10252 type:complete len:519 (-) Transcript_6990:7-1563(-)